MSGYPHNTSGYGYGYGAPPPGSQSYGSSPYLAPPPQGYGTPYGAPTPPQPQGQSPYAPVAQPYGASPSAPPYDHKPPKEQYSSSAGAAYPPSGPNYSSPFGSLVPSAFPPGTDPNVVACFQIADQDGSGLIDDKELQTALSSYNQSFSLRTVHLLMHLFNNSNTRKIGPKEFTAVFYSLQSWRDIFERFDRDRSGKIDSSELREALLSLGFAVSPVVLDLLVSKFDKTGGRSKAIEYDNFIECCLTVKVVAVDRKNGCRLMSFQELSSRGRGSKDTFITVNSIKGLTEKFKEKDKAYSGSATFTYETFMMTVLPFLIA